MNSSSVSPRWQTTSLGRRCLACHAGTSPKDVDWSRVELVAGGCGGTLSSEVGGNTMHGVDPLGQLLGKSPGIVAVRDQVRGLLRRQADARRLPPILVQGETGTGKGLVARAIHAASVRAGGPFVDVNCAAIPETLLEAEMFGVERGAFTDARQSKPGLFQIAHHGTIFLDEIGLLSEALQAKLLKVIEERQVRRLGGTRSEPVDVWVVAATNEDLAAATSARRFRADLYHRLAVVTFSLPALRERGDDVLLLAEHFLARACADYGMPPKTLAADARGALLRYSWPGNIRELSNVMERVVLLGADEQVTAATLGLPESAAVPANARGTAPSAPEAAVDDVERAHLLDALGATNWNVSQAAARLGISRNALRHLIEKHGLRRGAPAPPRRRRGAAAVSGVTLPAPASVTPSPVTRERRRLTLLRAVLIAPNGAETSAGNRRTLELLGDKAAVFGGRVEDVSASAIVAVFGLEPVEDAPARAAHAAIALVNGVERLRREEARELQVKIAIHVDQFLVDPGPGSAIDQKARSAAWAVLGSLLEDAEPGDIVVSQAAALFLERRFDLTLAPAGRAFRLGGHERTGLGLRRRVVAFFGRQHELELLRSRFDSAADGRGQIVGIAGDAGIGKSRLLLELRHRLTGQAVDYLQGQCVSYGSATPYLPVLDMLRITCRIARTDAPEVAAGKVRTVLHRLGMNAAERAPYLLHLLGLKDGGDQVAELSPEVFKARIFDTLRELALRRSQQRPLVLALEDLHWIDQSSEELFAAMVEVIPSARIMLISTYRSGYRPAWIDKSYATKIALQPLPAEESFGFVRTLLGSHGVSDAVVQAILGKAEGNPFFLEELTRSVREQRLTSPSLAVPDTVQEVLLARIDRLLPAERRLLQTAAVVGRDVPLPLLEAVAGFLPADLRHGLAALRAAEFLYETSVGSEIEYTFKHALIQEVAYESLDEDRRRQLHAAIVGAIEELYPQRLGEHVDRLADHAVKGEFWGKAVSYLRKAAAKAASRSANREAVAYLTRALAALDRLAPSRGTLEQAVDLRFELKKSLTPLAEYARVFDALREAEPMAEKLGDPRRLGRVYVYESDYFRLMGDPDRAIEFAQRALNVARALDDFALEVTANTYSGLAYYTRGEYRRASAFLSENVRLLAGDAERQRCELPYLPSVHSRAWLGCCHAELGAFPEAIVRADEAIRIAEGVNDPLSLTAAHFSRGQAHLRRGDFPNAVPALERALEVSREGSIELWFPTIAAALGSAYVLSGRAQEALALLEAAVAQETLMKRIGSHSARLIALGHGYLTVGRLESASQVGQRALDLARGHGERGYQAWALRLLGEIAAHSGSEVSVARRHYTEAIELADSLEMRPLLGQCHFGLGSLYRAGGEPGLARPHLQAAMALFRTMAMPFWEGKTQSEQAKATTD